MRTNILLGAVVLVSLAAAAVAAPEKKAALLEQSAEKAVADDLQAMQGRWVRQYANRQGAVFRVERDVDGGTDTLTEFDANGNVVHSHGSTFQLKHDGGVRVLTFSNLTVTAGPHNGLQQPAPASFLYRLEGETMFEVWGLLEGDRRPPSIIVWQRPKKP